MGTPEKFQISKHQKPNSKHQRNPKFQALNRGQRFELGAWSFSGVWSLVFGVWDLVLLWSLEFGIWSLLPGLPKIEMRPADGLSKNQTGQIRFFRRFYLARFTNHVYRNLHRHRHAVEGRQSG